MNHGDIHNTENTEDPWPGNGELSSVGPARVGAYRWERRDTPLCEVDVPSHVPADDC